MTMPNYVPLIPANGSAYYGAHGIPFTPIFIHPTANGPIQYLYPTDRPFTPVWIVVRFLLAPPLIFDLDLSIWSSSSNAFRSFSISNESIRCIDSSISAPSAVDASSSSKLSRSTFRSISSNSKEISSQQIEIRLNCHVLFVSQDRRIDIGWENEMKRFDLHSISILTLKVEIENVSSSRSSSISTKTTRTDDEHFRAQSFLSLSHRFYCWMSIRRYSIDISILTPLDLNIVLVLSNHVEAIRRERTANGVEIGWNKTTKRKTKEKREEEKRCTREAQSIFQRSLKSTDHALFTSSHFLFILHLSASN